MAVYWVLDGYHDIWNRWAVRQVRALHAAHRMFEERDHVHTLLYRFAWEHRREPDGVPSSWPWTIPTGASSRSGWTGPRTSRTSASGTRCATSLLPGLMPGSDAGLVAAFTPLPLLIDAPGDVPRQEADRPPDPAPVVPRRAPDDLVGARHRRAHRAGSRPRGWARWWPPCRSSRRSRAPTPTPISCGPEGPPLRAADQEGDVAPRITIVGGGSTHWTPRLLTRLRQHRRPSPRPRWPSTTSTRRRSRAMLAVGKHIAAGRGIGLQVTGDHRPGHGRSTVPTS